MTLLRLTCRGCYMTRPTCVVSSQSLTLLCTPVGWIACYAAVWTCLWVRHYCPKMMRFTCVKYNKKKMKQRHKKTTTMTATTMKMMMMKLRLTKMKIILLMTILLQSMILIIMLMGMMLMKKKKKMAITRKEIVAMTIKITIKKITIMRICKQS